MAIRFTLLTPLAPILVLAACQPEDATRYENVRGEESVRDSYAIHFTARWNAEVVEHVNYLDVGVHVDSEDDVAGTVRLVPDDEALEIVEEVLDYDEEFEVATAYPEFRLTEIDCDGPDFCEFGFTLEVEAPEGASTDVNWEAYIHASTGGESRFGDEARVEIRATEE